MTTDPDIQRLIDSAAAAVRPVPDNFDGVRKRAKTLRVRRTVTVLAAAAVFAVTAAAPALLAGSALPPPPPPLSSVEASPSAAPTLASSAQQLVVDSWEIQRNLPAVLVDVRSVRWIEIGPDRTITTVSDHAAVEIEDKFLPGHSDGDACAKVDQFAVRFDATGKEVQRRRLPKTCDMFNRVLGVDGDMVYLDRDFSVSSFNLRTGQHAQLFTTKHKKAAGFSGSTIAVVELAGEPDITRARGGGESVRCNDKGWNIRTYHVVTGEQRSQQYHPATPCGWQWSVSISPDGTRVALLRDKLDRLSAVMVDMLSGKTFTHDYGPSQQAKIIGMVWADNATAWAAWFPMPQQGTRTPLRDILQISVFRPWPAQ